MFGESFIRSRRAARAAVTATVAAVGLLGLTFAVGCGGNNTPAMPDAFVPTCTTAVSFSTVQSNILTPTCAVQGCHGSAPFRGGLDMTANNAYNDLVNATATIAPTKKRVVPGDPASSFMWQKLTDNLSSSEGLPMPNNGQGRLPGQLLDEVYCWIKGGAPNN